MSLDAVFCELLYLTPALPVNWTPAASSVATTFVTAGPYPAAPVSALVIVLR